jgi:hypothetical protein
VDTDIKVVRFIILIPHRDALKQLEEYRQELFSSGVLAAHSFPLAAPLAEVSKPFSRKELKETAFNIRELAKDQDGKIAASRTAIAESPGFLSFFGPCLNIPLNGEVFSQEARGKVLHVLFPPVLCAATVEPGTNPAEKPHAWKEAPAFSFRAASLANLSISPLPGAELSFEWRISPPVWLPAYKKRATNDTN